VASFIHEDDPGYCYQVNRWGERERWCDSNWPGQCLCP
jgi:hypothetical protein